MRGFAISPRALAGNRHGLQLPLCELLTASRAHDDGGLVRVIKMRMHSGTRDTHNQAAGLRTLGETDERMRLLNAWREAPGYSARERAALSWVEAITLVTQGHVPDDVFEAARQEFSEKEIVDLTAAAIAINSWNRIAIAFRVLPQVESKKAAA